MKMSLPGFVARRKVVCDVCGVPWAWRVARRVQLFPHSSQYRSSLKKSPVRPDR